MSPDQLKPPYTKYKRIQPVGWLVNIIRKTGWLNYVPTTWCSYRDAEKLTKSAAPLPDLDESENRIRTCGPLVHSRCSTIDSCVYFGRSDYNLTVRVGICIIHLETCFPKCRGQGIDHYSLTAVHKSCVFIIITNSCQSRGSSSTTTHMAVIFLPLEYFRIIKLLGIHWLRIQTSGYIAPGEDILPAD